MATHAKTKKDPRDLKPRGGARPGAGRKNADVVAIRALQRRLPDEATPEEKALFEECQQSILKVMRKPARYAQMQLSAATNLLDQLCGKVADRLKLDDAKVTVEIRESPKPVKPTPTEELNS